MEPTRFANLRSKQIDHALATKTGVPVQIEGDPSFTIFVRQFGGANRRSEYVAAQLGREAGIRDLEGVDRDEAAYAMNLELAVRELVAGWDGLVDADGQEIPFSEDAARDLLSEFPEVLGAVLVASADDGRFRIQADRKSDPGAG